MDERIRAAPTLTGWPAPRSAPFAAPAARRSGDRWDLLLACIAVYIATGVGRVHELFPVLLPLKPALVATVLAFGLTLLQQSGLRRLNLLGSPACTCLLALIAWSACSVPGALNQGVAFFTWTDLARTGVMCLLLAGSVRSVRDVERLTFVYFGVVALYTAVVLSRFEIGPADWRLGHLYDYDANDFATLIVTAMPIGLYHALGRRDLLVRIAVAVGLAVLTTGLIRSGSRGGFIAFLAVGAFMLFGFTTIPARLRVGGVVLILVLAGLSTTDEYWSQMQTIVHPAEDYNTTSDAGRVKIWERGLGYMAGNPVLGVGPGNFNVAEGTISPLAKLQDRGIGVRWGAAHNTFIQIGAELGIPGLLFFAGLLVTTIVSLRRVVRYGTRAGPAAHAMAPFAQAIMAAVVGFTVGSFFLSLAYMDMFYVIAAFAMALAKVARADAARSWFDRAGATG